MSLPGLGFIWRMDSQSELLGIQQLYYQRALGANLNTARSGILFCCFPKIIDAYHLSCLAGYHSLYPSSKGLFQNEMLGADGLLNQDKTVHAVNLLPCTGVKDAFSFAADCCRSCFVGRRKANAFDHFYPGYL